VRQPCRARINNKKPKPRGSLLSGGVGDPLPCPPFRGDKAKSVVLLLDERVVGQSLGESLGSSEAGDESAPHRGPAKSVGISYLPIRSGGFSFSAVTSPASVSAQDVITPGKVQKVPGSFFGPCGGPFQNRLHGLDVFVVRQWYGKNPETKKLLINLEMSFRFSIAL
jgi:hypothetical protein